MIVYVYNIVSNDKIAVYKNITEVKRLPNYFWLYDELNSKLICLPADDIKIVVYGF